MGLVEFLDKYKGLGNRPDWLTPRAVMNDGFHISIQCSNCHYCAPREDVGNDMYYQFELGYPSEHDDLLNGLGEDENQTETVFPYVEKSVLESLIKKHGGIKGMFHKD